MKLNCRAILTGYAIEQLHLALFGQAAVCCDTPLAPGEGRHCLPAQPGGTMDYCHGPHYLWGPYGTRGPAAGCICRDPGSAAPDFAAELLSGCGTAAGAGPALGRFGRRAAYQTLFPPPVDGGTRRSADRLLREEFFVSAPRRSLCLDASEATVAAARLLRPGDLSVYIGIPFCPTRCVYCSFVSQSVERCAPSAGAVFAGADPGNSPTPANYLPIRPIKSVPCIWAAVRRQHCPQSRWTG